MIHLVDLKILYEKNQKLAVSIAFDYFKKMEEQGLLKYYDITGTIKNYIDFINFSLDKSGICMLVWDMLRQESVAHVHLKDFEGYACRIHFNILRENHGLKAYDLAREVHEEVFSLRRKENLQEPITSTLVGVTPTTNKAACRFVKRFGYKELAVLDRVCYSNEIKDYVPGMLTIMTENQFRGLYGYRKGRDKRVPGSGS